MLSRSAQPAAKKICDDRLPLRRNRSNGWHYPGANSFARYSEEGNLLKPITWQFYHLSNT
jgi:hypothetical protein